MREIIQRAVRGGFTSDANRFLDDIKKLNSFYEINISMHFIDSLIFSHEFLKAYFGEEKVYDGYLDPMLLCDKCAKIEVQATVDNALMAWQYHAQQLVLSEDREQYLKNFLK